MFGNGTAIAWSEFFSSGNTAPVSTTPVPTANADTGSDNVIKTVTTAASTRNVSELQAQIRQHGGVLTVGPNASEYLVAINNRLRFTVTRNASGQFEIRETNYLPYIVGGAVLLGAVLLLNRS